MSRISAIIPTYLRTSQLKFCLEIILACNPIPSEIIIHIDAGDAETEPFLLSQKYPFVSWISSSKTQGPGGGRNKLIKQAQFPLVASFDDDSWPLNPNYFQIASEVFDAYPQAAVISAQEFRRNAEPTSIDSDIREISCFQNCACLIRRDAFLQTRGYLPLRYAYGMEEADVALQLLDAGWKILDVPSLAVYHDTQLEHHNTVAINSSHISNTALLAYLRYPISAWPLGMMQVLNRVRYAASVGRWRGIPQGIWQIPHILWRYRNQRYAVHLDTLALSRKLASKS